MVCSIAHDVNYYEFHIMDTAWLGLQLSHSFFLIEPLGEASIGHNWYDISEMPRSFPRTRI